MDRYEELFLELPLPPPTYPTSKVEVGEKAERDDKQFEVDLTIKAFEISI